jgi:phosphatidylglycerol lysyltransferase
MKKHFLHSLGPLLGLSLFAVALWVIHNELREYHYHDIVRHVRDLPLHYLSVGLGLTILNYLIMSGYDLLAIRYIHYQLPYRKIAVASFIGYAFSNSIGLSMLAGASVRYRLYSAWGLSSEEITKVVAFCSLTLWFGFLTLGGIIFLLEPMVVPKGLHLPFVSVRPFGVIFLCLVGGFFLWSLLRKKPLKFRNWEFPFPSPGLFIAQISIASLDWALAGSILYALLPATSNLSYAEFIPIYLLAQLVGLVSQVPGGIGVFESMVLLLLSPTLPASSLFGTLLVYRLIYYLLPLIFAAALLGTQEIIQRREGIKRAARLFGQWVPELAPYVLSITTFIGGIILLFSGATPAVGSRLVWLKDFLPLPVIEISHFLGSLAGVGLLLLARGLQRRLDAAYILTVALLGAGIVFSLLKGADYEEAIILSVMLGVLLPCRRRFYRKTSLLSQRITVGWAAAIFLVFLGSIWLGIFSYKHVEYSHDLWWHFTFFADASRFLRATVGAISLAIFFAVARLLHPTPPEPALPSGDDLEKVRLIVEESRRTYANLALLGDKELLFSDSGKAFIMYGIEGRSWIALGDPIGPKEDWSELIWRFREASDRHGGWTVFYEVSQENLHLYLDLGLTFIKIGEEARVPLGTFSLEGATHKGFRHTLNRFEKEGGNFELIPAKGISSFLSEFKRISEAWLSEKNTREKGFSLGFFNEDYIKRFPAALVRREGKILAFANIWPGAEKEELSLDLMRYLPESPHGVMDYLFIQLMLWGKREGYRWFNLGMAPLSGLETHALAPLWNRLGAFVFRHGEHFYNFQGLRQYKEKFGSEWQPKYLATPGGLKLPRILTNIATLISGGLKGIVIK